MSFKERLVKLLRKNDTGVTFLDRETGKISKKRRGSIERQMVVLNPEQSQVLRKVARHLIEREQGNDVSN